MIARIHDLLLSRTFIGSHREADQRIWEWFRSWDFKQTNDGDVWNNESGRADIDEALEIWKTDKTLGFQLYLALAEQGSVFCMGKVAYLYWLGIGVSADVERAEFWNRRAFERGSTRAMLEYAKLLAARGDFRGAEAVYEKGAADGWAPAQFWLAWYRLKRSDTRQMWLRVRPLLESAAAQGSPAAQRELGRALSVGRFGIREIPRGLKLFTAWNNRALERLKQLAEDSTTQPS
jgi:TPR repeat protein